MYHFPDKLESISCKLQIVSFLNEHSQIPNLLAACYNFLIVSDSSKSFLYVLNDVTVRLNLEREG